MRLLGGGVDVVYIDESMDRYAFAMSAVAVPFLRNVEGTWTFVWEDQFRNVRDWRRRAKANHGVPVRKELKGSKLASGRGRYAFGRHSLARPVAARVYRSLLSDLGFMQDLSIITVVGSRQSNLYGHRRLEALLYALLQRLRTACHKTSRRGMVFFDEGHGEYRKLYRRARVHLPTGSMMGGWGSGALSKNLPLDNFTKDANIKQSQHSFFIQLADIISYAALVKIKSETNTLEPWQAAASLGNLYDSIPVRVLNTFASRSDPQGIVRL